jgi:Protein kinase domain
VKKQILRELNFNKNCASDHICQYYGAFMDKSSSTISIAMEFCEGGSLDSVYKEVKKLGGRTGEKVLGKVAEGVLHGLTYLNSRKIIHRGKCAAWFHRVISDCCCRYQAFEYLAMPRWPGQTLRLWRQWGIWYQRRC